MDLRQLRHFAAVIEMGSLSRAAQHLNLTQPALTRSVKALEEDVGTRLVERGPSGVIATSAGLAMYRHARFMITETGRARQEVQLAAAGVNGQLSIAIEPAFAEFRAHGAIGRLCDERGPLDLTIREVFVEQAVKLLQDGEIDLALIVAPANAMQPGLVFDPLGPVSSTIFVGCDHPLAAATSIDKAELAQQRWAILDHAHAQDMLVRYFASGRQGMPIDVVRTDTMVLMRRLVANDGFVAFLPEHTMAKETVVALSAPDMPVVRQAGLLHRADREMQPLAALLVKFLRKEFISDG